MLESATPHGPDRRQCDYLEMSKPAPMYLPGQEVAGRFEIVTVLGAGGFATVYKVFDQLEQQYWAMKVFAKTQAEEALRREIGSLRAVQHPHVMHVVWADKTPDGHLYLLSELLLGETLEKYAYGEERLPDQEVLRLGDQLLDALTAVHPDQERIDQLQCRSLSQEEWEELQQLKASGFVHRDVKPANLMLTGSGLKLLDFNIASRVGDPVFTSSGTPAYQPPDLDLASWSPQVDLFATGITLFELLCHAHPYPEGQPRAHCQPLSPKSFRSDLPARLGEFLLRACAPQAEQRFATAKQMRAELQSLVEKRDLPKRAASAGGGEAPRAEDSGGKRSHVINEGSSDVVTVKPFELKEIERLAGDWPAVFSCNDRGDVWATFGNQQNLQGEHDLLDLSVRIVTRERRGGGRFQISDEGVYVWSLERSIAEFAPDAET